MNSNIKQLPIDERIRLVEDLWDSIAADQNALPFTQDQKNELDKRLDAYELSKDPGRPMNEILSEIRNKL